MATPEVVARRSDKRIYKWINDGKEYAVGVMLVGYCPDTLAYFNAMFKVAKEIFPKIKEEDVTCGKVQRSDRIKEFTLILFTVDPKAEASEEWKVHNHQVDFGY